MTRLCLVGYGKMGRMLHELCPQKDCEVVSIIDPVAAGANREITAEALNHADVCLEFSHPAAVVQNLQTLIRLKQNIVVGTTGWSGAQAGILADARAAGIGMIYGANFSLGMNLFSRILESAVQIIDHFDEYDIFGSEMHHAQKADSPSGTAIELARIILEHSQRKSKVVWDKLDRKPEQGEMHFASLRGGHVPGTHMVGFDSEADTIELTHRVRSRSTFASGALVAAKWIAGRQGVFSISEVIADILC
jgi:4-hydroxy-tetrahydrodipicolinate reductase